MLKLLTVLNISEEKFRPEFNFLGHSLKIVLFSKYLK